EVELDEFLIAPEAVAPPLRLVRESVAREVQRADPESCAQLPGHVKPVDAAGGPAVDEQQHRSARVAELNVENLNRTGVLRRRPPGEMATTTSPVLSPRHGHDPGLLRQGSPDRTNSRVRAEPSHLARPAPVLRGTSPCTSA